MALKLSTELPTGIVATDAYYKIERVVSTKEKMVISVQTYFNQQARNNNNQILFSEVYEIEDQADIDKHVKGHNANSGDIIQRGYIYLKEKIDKFSNALDV